MAMIQGIGAGARRGDQSNARGKKRGRDQGGEDQEADDAQRSRKSRDVAGRRGEDGGGGSGSTD